MATADETFVADDDQDRGSFLAASALKYAQIGQASQAQQVVQALESTTAQQQLIQQINCYVDRQDS